jgi:hypothetical protein
MTGSYEHLECPVCGSLMGVPRHSGRALLTCRNGHRFVRGKRPRRARWPVPGPFLALAISVLLIALFLAQRFPAGIVTRIHVG